MIQISNMCMYVCVLELSLGLVFLSPDCGDGEKEPVVINCIYLLETNYLLPKLGKTTTQVKVFILLCRKNRNH